MAQNPSDDIRKAKAEADKFRLAIDRVGKDIDATMGDAARHFLDKTGKMRKGFNDEIQKMVDAFAGGASKIDPRHLSKPFQEALKSIKVDITGKQGVDIKDAMQRIMTVAPTGAAKRGGIGAMAAMFEENAARINLGFIAKHRTARQSIEGIVKFLGHEGDAAKRTSGIFAAGRQYEMLALVNQFKMSMAIASASERDEVKSTFRKKAARIEELSNRTKLEEASAGFAARNVKMAATEASARKGLVSTIMKHSSTAREAILGLAVAEQRSAKATAEGRGEVREGLSMRQQGLQVLLGTMMKISTAIQPMTILSGVLMRVIENFDRTRKAGAGALEVMSTTRGLREGDFGLVGPTKMMGEMAIRATAIRKEIGMFSPINIQELQLSAAAAAKTMGGMGSNTAGVIDELTRIQVLAPLAGVDGREAMEMIGKAHKAIGLGSGKQMTDFFNRIRIGARTAQMGLQDFAQAINLEQMATRWGMTADQAGRFAEHVAALSKVAMPGATVAQRGLLMGTLGQIGNMDLIQSMAMRMVGGRGTAETAFADIANSKGSPLDANIGAFRQAMQRLGLTGNDNRSRMMFSLYANQAFGADAGVNIARTKGFREAILGQGNMTGDMRKALQASIDQGNPMKLAADLAKNQLGVLEQIQRSMEEFFQAILTLISSSAFFSLKGNAAAERMMSSGVMRSFEENPPVGFTGAKR